MSKSAQLRFQNVIIIDVENEEETLKQVREGEGRRSIVRSTTYPVSHLGATVLTIHVSNTSLIKSQAIVATAKVIANSASFKTNFETSYVQIFLHNL